MSNWNSMSQFTDNPTRNTSFHAFNSSNWGRLYWWPSSDVSCLTLNRHCVPLVKSETTVRIQDWPIRASQMHEMPLSSSALPLWNPNHNPFYLFKINKRKIKLFQVTSWWRHRLLGSYQLTESHSKINDGNNG